MRITDTHGRNASKLEIRKKFGPKNCAVSKRRRLELIPRIMEMDSEAMLEALKPYSGRPEYLFWKNENLEIKSK